MFTPERPRTLSRRGVIRLGAAAVLPILTACASKEEEIQRIVETEVAKRTSGQPQPAAPREKAVVEAPKPDSQPTPATRFERNVKELKLLWQKEISRGGEINYQIWPFPRYGVYSPPNLALSQNAIFFLGSKDGKPGKFSALELATGTEIWPKKPEFGGIPISVWGDTVWVMPFIKDNNQTNNSLLALSVKDGTEKFNIPFVPPLNNTPVAFNDKLLFITHNDLSRETHHVMELDQTNGRIEQKAEIAAQYYLLTIFMVTRDYIIIDFDYTRRSSSFARKDPELRVIAKFGGGNLSTPSRTGFTRPLFLGAIKDKENHELLLALYENRSGSQETTSIAVLSSSSDKLVNKWEIPLQTPQDERPLWLADDILLLAHAGIGGGGPIQFRALEPQTGLPLWTNDKIFPRLVLGTDNNNVYVTTDRQKATTVAALDKKDGKRVVWEQKYEMEHDSYPPITWGSGLFGNHVILGLDKKLNFLNRADGLPARPAIPLNFEPVNLYSTSRFLVVEGLDKVAVIG